MFYKISYILTKLYEILTLPVSFLSPFFVVLYWSVLSSFVILIFYKLISSPSSIRKAKDQIKANIFAIRIYSDLPGVFFKSFSGSLYWTFRYFLLNLIPVLFLIIVLLPLFVQLELRYGIEPLKVGDEFIMKVKFNEISELEFPKIKLLNDKSFKEIVRVFIPELNEYDLKLRVLKNSSKIYLDVNGEKVEKTIVIGEKGKLFSPKKLKADNPETLLYPEDKPLYSSSIEEISIITREGEINFLGIKLHWLIYYLILTIIIVLALKDKFGVEF